MLATWLPKAAARTGYPVRLVPGWESRGHGEFVALEGVVCHHTGTPDSAPGDYPSLAIVTRGRSDLPGPLCQYGLGRSGTIYVVAAGVAWHAGQGSGHGIPTDDANRHTVGIEAESGGVGVWTPQQRDCYPKLVAEALREMGQPTERAIAHREWAVVQGKVDPIGPPDMSPDFTVFRGEVERLLHGAPAPAAPAPDSGGPTYYNGGAHHGHPFPWDGHAVKPWCPVGTTIKPGDRGDRVTQLERALGLSATGFWGYPGLTTAVVDRKHGLGFTDDSSAPVQLRQGRPEVGWELAACL